MTKSVESSMLMSRQLTGILICSYSTGEWDVSSYIRILILPFLIRMMSSVEKATLLTKVLISPTSTGQDLQENSSNLDPTKNINLWSLTLLLCSKRLTKLLKRDPRNKAHPWPLWIKFIKKPTLLLKRWFPITKCHSFELWLGSFTRFSSKSMKKLLLTIISWSFLQRMITKKMVHSYWFLRIDHTSISCWFRIFSLHIKCNVRISLLRRISWMWLLCIIFSELVVLSSWSVARNWILSTMQFSMSTSNVS